MEFALNAAGRILNKKTKGGRIYYGCEKNPTCDFMTWDEPLKEQCPKCGSSLLKKKDVWGKFIVLKKAATTKEV